MQVAFDEAHVEQQSLLDQDTELRQSKLQALLEDIVATKPRGAAANEALYRKVHVSCSLNARLDMDNAAAVRAAAAALESVLPRSGIGALSSLPPKQKLQQLQELANIVAGILLFNMATNRSGAFVDDGTLYGLFFSISHLLTSACSRIACAIAFGGAASFAHRRITRRRSNDL